jgi:excinuclease UvrABC nuclease subunit
MEAKLLNFTTEIAAEKTVGEIQRKLAQAGASQILHGYDHDGNLNELSFRIETQFGVMAFRLPANVEAVQAILQRQFKSGRSRFTSREHATKVAWRILKDWMEAQMALLRTGQVTIEQAFLAYAQNAKGQTIYETLVEKRFAGMLTEGDHENRAGR